MPRQLILCRVNACCTNYNYEAYEEITWKNVKDPDLDMELAYFWHSAIVLLLTQAKYHKVEKKMI